MRQYFPAKVLLFGEHRVLRGASALAVPYHGLGASWQFGEASDAILRNFADFLLKEINSTLLNKEKIKRDIQAGLRLSSNIPFGYGLGSSGTLCAAFWDRYHTKAAATQLSSIADIQHILAKMESFFHGQSSGLDPLVSFMNQAFQINPTAAPRPCSLAKGWEAFFFLLDTQIPRKAGPLIQQFTNRYDNNKGWKEEVEQKWGQADKQCQEAILEGDFETLTKTFRKLSKAQQNLAPFLFPEAIKNYCIGLSYSLKVCGAGGGGYMLGCTENWQQTQTELARWPLLTF